MVRTAVVILATAVVVTGVRGDAGGNERSALVLREKAASTAISDEGGAICKPSPKANVDYYIVLTQRQAQAERLYVDPSVQPACNSTPRAFYLDLKKGMQDGYRLLAREEYFEATAPTSPGQPYRVKLRPLKHLFPTGQGTAFAAVAKLWARDISGPFADPKFTWKPRASATSRGNAKVDGEAVSIEMPQGWKGGQLALVVGKDELTWQVNQVLAAEFSPTASPTPASPTLASPTPASPTPASPTPGRSVPYFFEGWSLLDWAIYTSGALFILGVLWFAIWKLLGAISRIRAPRRREDPNWIRSIVEEATMPSRSALEGRMSRLEEVSRKRIEELQHRVENVEKNLPVKPKEPPPKTPYTDPPADKLLPAAERHVRTAAVVREGPISGDVERVALQVLDLVEPAGRRAPLASVAGLTEWLAVNAPGIEAHPVGALNNELWRIVVLSANQKEGVAIPALDITIGPGEIMKWYGGGRYDGTQVLVRANVRALARAERNPAGDAWVPSVRGDIELS